MSNVDTEIKETKSPKKKTVLLNIEPRFQWDHGNGYCGETALQCIGLYYGVWLSQSLIRNINQGEYLLQQLSPNDKRDPLRTLNILHFTYNEWDWINSPQPQFRSYCRWLKQSIVKKHPVMLGLFLPGMDYEDYDHIVPVIGIQYTNEDQYDPNDKIMYYDLYSKKKFEGILNENELGSTRKSIIKKKYSIDGCIPLDVDYGISITGIVDENQVTVPVSLSVSSWNEPDPELNKDPIEMNGIITVYNLTVGNTYVLLRYSSYKHVQTKGDANTFLRSRFSTKHEFIADNTTYVYEDPLKISSNRSVYYRCISLTND